MFLTIQDRTILTKMPKSDILMRITMIVTNRHFSPLISPSKTLAFLALFGYLSFAIFGFLHLLQMTSHHHMSESDCPFTEITQTVCPPTLLSHTKLWQDFSSLAFWKNALLLSLTYSLLLLVGSFLFIATTIKKLFLYAKQQAPPRTYGIHQTLFSQGILNTKIH